MLIHVEGTVDRHVTMARSDGIMCLCHSETNPDQDNVMNQKNGESKQNLQAHRDMFTLCYKSCPGM